jgi:hypothetical protein
MGRNAGARATAAPMPRLAPVTTAIGAPSWDLNGMLLEQGKSILILGRSLHKT